MVTTKSNILLVVDLHADLIEDKKVYDKILEYIIIHRRAYPSIISVVTKPLADEQLNKYLNWTGTLGKEPVNFKFDTVLTKNQYGLNGYGSLSKDDHIDIIGMDIDSNVMKIAYDLFDRRYDFSVLTKYCYSTGGKEISDQAIAIMRKNLGNAII